MKHVIALANSPAAITKDAKAIGVMYLVNSAINKYGAKKNKGKFASLEYNINKVVND